MLAKRLYYAYRTALRVAFALLVARPVCLLWLGLTVHHKERLPLRGPAILIANHNSHLDTLALLALFPLHVVPSIRPVAAADYFMSNRLIAWFSLHVVGILPVLRGTTPVALNSTLSASKPVMSICPAQVATDKDPLSTLALQVKPGNDTVTGAGPTAARDPLSACYKALSKGQILVIFPEGTRGEGERFKSLKKGIFHIAQRYPNVPVIPVYMQGLGKSMPRGELVPLPLFVDVYVGAPVEFTEDKSVYMQRVSDAFTSQLREHGRSAYRDDPHPEDSTHPAARVDVAVAEPSTKASK